jgi:hypothetical protein
MRMGQIILQNGIPHVDTLSYTMPGYPYVDHEWGMDILYALAYPMIGLFGLAASTAGIMIVALLFAISVVEDKTYIEIPLIFLGGVLINFVSVRPQVITWLGLCIVLCIASSAVRWQRWKYTLPFVFLCWANLHGGFIAGVGILGILLILKKDFKYSDISILLACILVTAINPYGVRLWQEIWAITTEGSFRWSIQEWAPAVLRPDVMLETAVMLCGMLVWNYRKRLPLVYTGLFFFWMVQGLSSQRHIPIWALFAIPVTTMALSEFSDEVAKNPISLRYFRRSYYIVYSIGIILFIWSSHLGFIKYSRASEQVFYPEQALIYLKEHPTSGNLFSQYGWGGYLDWKFPQKQVFIDGRMAGWRQGTQSIFAEYVDVETGKTPFIQIEKKYSITTVLWPIWDMSRTDMLTDTLQLLWNRQILKKKEQKPFLFQLVDQGWKPIYRDSTAVILRKF